MSTPFSGDCLCGAVRYECSAEPLFVAQCHCRDCQQESGSAYTTNLVVPAAAVHFTTPPKYHEKPADRGHTMSRGFCPTCGSRVAVTNAALPTGLILHAAGLDDPSWVKPTMDIYTQSAQPWDYMDPALQKFPAMPPMNLPTKSD